MRSIFESFPNTKRVLFPEDIKTVNNILIFIEDALQNKRDILKTGSDLYWTTPTDSLLRTGSWTSKMTVSECMDFRIREEIQKRFQDEVINEIDRLVEEKIQLLKTQYNVAYIKNQPKHESENFND